MWHISFFGCHRHYLALSLVVFILLTVVRLTIDRSRKMGLESFSLAGKTALITGGAGLLGLQHAAAILEVGGSVVITDLKESELFEAKKSPF